MKTAVERTLWRTLAAWLCAVVIGCAAPVHSIRQESDSSWDAAAYNDGEPLSEGSIDCLALVCDEHFCWGVRCEEGEVSGGSTGHVVLARGALVLPGPVNINRYRGSVQPLLQDRVPVFVIPWSNHDRRPLLPPGELESLRKHAQGPGKLVKHHIFPWEFEEWFTSKGINIHKETMLLEEHIHKDIHRGASGGAWNAAWRDFKNSKFNATKEEIWRFAGELLHRFNINGPIVPYYGRVMISCHRVL